MTIDLRSDTVSKPDAKMLDYMIQAEVGDDVLGDDPTVAKLEEKAANLFGKEAGLFCPSGTMCNQIAIKVHSNAPGEVICSKLAHIHLYEGGGIGFNSGLSTKLLEGDRGRFDLDQLKAAINPDDVHFPPTQLVSIEDTCNKGGGSVWDLAEIKKIAEFCQKQNLPLHLDGARVFNALVAKNQNAVEYGKNFDSISICLSKGLGAPVGSVLLGTKAFIKKARRIRKIFGGGMRQAGYLAAAGIYALDHNVKRLSEDHKRAKQIGELLRKKEQVERLEEVETNILLFRLKGQYSAEEYLAELKEKGILAVSMGAQLIRFVFHLNLTEEQVVYLEQNL